MLKTCSHPYFYIKQPAQIVYFIQTYLSFLTIPSGYIKRHAGKPTVDFLSLLLYYTFIFLFCEYHLSKIPEISPELSSHDLQLQIIPVRIIPS